MRITIVISVRQTGHPAAISDTRMAHGSQKRACLHSTNAKVIVLGIFVTAVVKLKQFVCHQQTRITRCSSPSKQGSYSATVGTGCDKQVCILTAH